MVGTGQWGQSLPSGLFCAIYRDTCITWVRSSACCCFHRDPRGISIERLQLQRQQKSTSKAYSIHLFHFILCLRRKVWGWNYDAGELCCAEVIWGVFFVPLHSQFGEVSQGRITPELKLMVSDDKLSHIWASTIHSLSHLCNYREWINTCSQELSGRGPALSCLNPGRCTAQPWPVSLWAGDHGLDAYY